MAQNGKYTSFFNKRGDAEKLGPKSPQAPDADPKPPAPDEADAAPADARHGRHRASHGRDGIRRVTGRMARPEYNAVMLADRAGEAAAQIRALRAKIVALNEGRPPRVIAVTSGSREEGKTTVACNLAVALSEIDPGRVILVDGDVLRPSVHQTLNISATSGLNDILHSSDLDLDDNVYETLLHNLDVLPARPISPEDEEEKTLHRVCGPLLEKLRRHYAFVIVDTPPVMAGSQASAFGKHSDGAVVVARMERTPRQVVRRAAEELSTAGAKVVGCILTHHRHHVPNLIYGFLGTTPSRYYRYGQYTDARGPDGNQTA
jgi:capsular exopolysaccharide synthesis family protein